jgi:NADP-dependent 3-hydroxy acid dehydrogenase YdfG
MGRQVQSTRPYLSFWCCFLKVVTGASDGIGREFALRLAEAGFNILLVARNRDMLAILAEEIGAQLNYLLLSYYSDSSMQARNMIPP